MRWDQQGDFRHQSYINMELRTNCRRDQLTVEVFIRSPIQMIDISDERCDMIHCELLL